MHTDSLFTTLTFLECCQFDIRPVDPELLESCSLRKAERSPVSECPPCSVRFLSDRQQCSRHCLCHPHGVPGPRTPGPGVLTSFKDEGSQVAPSGDKDGSETRGRWFCFLAPLWGVLSTRADELCSLPALSATPIPFG